MKKMAVTWDSEVDENSYSNRQTLGAAADIWLASRRVVVPPTGAFPYNP